MTEGNPVPCERSIDDEKSDIVGDDHAGVAAVVGELPILGVEGRAACDEGHDVVDARGQRVGPLQLLVDRAATWRIPGARP